MTLGPKLKQNYRHTISLICNTALDKWDNPNRETKVAEVGLLNICRMLVWMSNGGYPTNSQAQDVELANEICLRVLKDMNLKPLELKEQIQLMIYPSPFTLEQDQIDSVEQFLRTLEKEMK